MSYLETKRNALMNAIASGQITNLLENATWLDGYFGGGGSISTPSANKEKYTDNYIEVEPLHHYALISFYGTFRNQWNRTCFYNSSQTYLEMQTFSNSDNRSDYSIFVFRTPNNTQYLRTSIRTYGSVDVAIVDFDDIDQWLESNITFENVTAQ